MAVHAGGTFSDRPTVTYTPIKGDFARVMLTPIPPSELFAMLTTGAPAELTLGLAVQSINGLHNWTADAQGEPNVDPEFAEARAAQARARRCRGLPFRYAGGPRTAYLLLEEQEGVPLEPRARRLLDLLHLDPGVRSFPIRFGFGRAEPSEIGIYTRSLIEILSNLAAQVEVPEDNVDAGRTYPTQLRPEEFGVLPRLAVSARGVTPRAVRRRGVPRHLVLDRRSRLRIKRVFSTLMLLLNLVDKSAEGQLPGDPDRLARSKLCRCTATTPFGLIKPRLAAQPVNRGEPQTDAPLRISASASAAAPRPARGTRTL